MRQSVQAMKLFHMTRAMLRWAFLRVGMLALVGREFNCPAGIERDIVAQEKGKKDACQRERE